MSARTTSKAVGVAATFDEWARAAHQTAVSCLTKGDKFGHLLATARSEVYALAAAFAADLEPDALAAECARNEKAHHFYPNSNSVPLDSFDGYAAEHVRAMAWQLCALEVDPAHQPIERPW